MSWWSAKKPEVKPVVKTWSLRIFYYNNIKISFDYVNKNEAYEAFNKILADLKTANKFLLFNENKYGQTSLISLENINYVDIV